MTKAPPAPERPQICLLTPPVVDLGEFPDTLARLLDGVEIACLRLGLAGSDADALGRVADALRVIAHERDVPVVIDRHVALARRHGLDGVHLTDGARSVRFARRELGEDAIIGAFCGVTRHEGINAAEAGADYVAFGPVGGDALGDGRLAGQELFAWWSEMIEVPVVAEGGLDGALVAALAPVADFFAFGEELWRTDDPLGALRALAARMS
jgi:thiamine-phosphate pyrophosphorylase